MSTLVLDAGALISLDRGDRLLWIRLDEARLNGTIQVPAGVIAQAWRDDNRQARLARALKFCDEVPMDGQVARKAGALCGQAKTSDVIDATVAVAAAQAAEHDTVSVVTSDRGDIAPLLDVLGVKVRLIDA